MRRTTIRSALPFSIIKKNNIKLPKFESLIVSEVSFCVHMNLAIQEAPAIFAESIISSIMKKEIVKH